MKHHKDQVMMALIALPVMMLVHWSDRQRAADYLPAVTENATRPVTQAILLQPAFPPSP
ncbi:hypothetical protein [Sodalis sp.]|uniref:hypothetical protein n=1 Tax=Sodalis sp. (in: enterobacteria) TaxID=1898979 RepID=UPI00387397D2